ncbi:bifunctional diaminohydroxyphosphoribosylaminopyrimidine deaminase/5-amino-6-(5-phosphoribosylamino)uracil reductase RibD [Hoeflea prorocentri]|uniref:Riboflavin biosynthesis protein RibD n=1 Tax=Hoeflea prorocentri TaxID=1922333 RepID=A0A9X3UH17_9HYPH|nr:bifunctional diaminohydroxyphosphoribosylaminopyrimidine deaminase/5-amino-6-(5-phosphoribosylamino)uracil reductase RibD [Hoeflea prorocentri]MCY6381243.1 bifunctional diaminohydroxyphosphoribosylaminopyrimidine deaminase/5-amino-6-(5-phosphoribosylamino)uracil reductase RibD [Hoeflea prorocentri]MDA5399043.1 bifunctional diaminohydroxyphosphoribosylaminopyrimidine deaminase/5-amino-6-(5-phosphoribosylamino)uracil reductase RibD [Hoeflea prorocentri]
MAVSEFDRRMMAAAIRYTYRHLGRTGTNPSVATILVRDVDGMPVIVGRGLTAIGGRPHAETEAIEEAGDLAAGSTAYVTLEPCAHHGSTPPCADALVSAGISRVVAATTDPDGRVSGLGYKILEDGGIEVETDVLAPAAMKAMAGYLTQRRFARPHVTLKLALSQDGKIGRKGSGQVPITDPLSNHVSHLLRATSDVIAIGINTALEDDPSLTCRLPGLENRSPIRLVLDRELRLPPDSALARSARDYPVIIATTKPPDDERYRQLTQAGCQMLACEETENGIALPEMLEDLCGKGIMTVIVEGGAAVAQAFLEAGLVDRIRLYIGPEAIGEDGIAAPLSPEIMPAGFVKTAAARFGPDWRFEYERSE